MIQIILIFIFILLLIYKDKFAEIDCNDISGQYIIVQKDPVFDNEITINLILEKDKDCIFSSNILKVKTLLNKIYIRDSEIKIEIKVTNTHLKGGQKIIYKEIKNNNFIEYTGYINNNNIYIKKNNEIFIIRKL
jgi:hypothetical protein